MKKLNRKQEAETHKSVLYPIYELFSSSNFEHSTGCGKRESPAVFLSSEEKEFFYIGQSRFNGTRNFAVNRFVSEHFQNQLNSRDSV